MTPKEILEAAKKKVEQGWCKGHYQRGNACCADGAIMLSAPADFSQYYLREKARLKLKVAIGPSCASIERWNDAKERRKKDVLAAFDKAIALCDFEERQ